MSFDMLPETPPLHDMSGSIDVHPSQRHHIQALAGWPRMLDIGGFAQVVEEANVMTV